MAGIMNIKPGTKMRAALDVPANQEPKFNMMCTFNKALDESAFLVSIPMVDSMPVMTECRARTRGMISVETECQARMNGKMPVMDGMTRSLSIPRMI